MAGSNFQQTYNTNKMVRGEIYDALRKGLCQTKGKSKKTFYESFIQNMLAEAEKDPKSPIGQLIARQIMQEDILAALDSETEKLLSRDQEFSEFRLMKQLYDEQKLVCTNNISRQILLCTGRRTGKTNLLARWLVNKCIKPNSPCLYIHTKFENAINQCYQLVLDAASAIELGVTRESRAEGKIEFSNGSSIKFAGNNNKASADMLRGYKYRGIAIDEAAYECNMQYLIEDVCTPMLADYADSQIILASTPPRAPHTYFEMCYNSRQWKVYQWNAYKNPFIPDFKSFLEGVCKSKSITMDSPFIKREGLGEFAYDTEAQVFKDYKTYDKTTQNPIKDLDLHIDEIVIGNDYGWAAYNGIVGVALDNKKKRGVVYFESKFNKADVSKIIQVNKNAVEIGKKILIEHGSDPGEIKIFGDTSDTPILEEMKRVHNLPAHQAWKYNKDEAITQLAEHCRTGQILIPKDGPIADEFDQILYERDEEDNITSEILDEPHPDIMFALLYASRHWCYKWGLPTGAKEVYEPTTAKEMAIAAGETDITDTRDIGLLDVGTGDMGRHFVR